MSTDKVTKIYSQFKLVEEQLEAIRGIYGKAKELGEITGESAVFTEAAYKLLDAAKEFVTLVEESDTNLDPETTKLEGVDKFFEGHHATEFVNMALNEVYNSQGVCANAPCKAEDKNCCMNKDDVKSAILQVTDPVEPFVRPNPGCKLICTRNHCSCEDGW
jgi:hypothetical protein